MPLIVVTGLPSSGKSTRSQQIFDFFGKRLKDEQIPLQVRIVSDSDNLDWEGRDCIYSSISKEKELRSWLRAEAQRYINLKQIVILDAAAYIKGFRYELYCMSKEAKTQYCVVENLIEPETCWKWNEQLKASADKKGDCEQPEAGYTRDTFDALVLRYEKCDDTNRWDSPLFKVTDQTALDVDRLFTVITKDEPLTSNKCTSLSTTNATIFKPTR